MNKILIALVLAVLMSGNAYSYNMDGLDRVSNKKCIDVLSRGKKMTGNKVSGMIMSLNGTYYFVQEDIGCWINPNDK
jgi:hypothetical protein